MGTPVGRQLDLQRINLAFRQPGVLGRLGSVLRVS